VTKVPTTALRGARPEAIWEKRGGQAVSGLGQAMIIGGLGAALVAAVVAQWLFPAGIVGYVLAAAIALATIPLGFVFRKAAGRLTLEGEARERAATLETIDQLAQATGRGVSAEELARLGGTTDEKADRVLTELAKTGDLRLEVTDEGDLLYYPKVQRLRAKGEDVKAIEHAPDGPPVLEDDDSAAKLPTTDARRR
jgi:hypothetical protein